MPQAPSPPPSTKQIMPVWQLPRSPGGCVEVKFPKPRCGLQNMGNSKQQRRGGGLMDGRLCCVWWLVDQLVT